MLPKTVYSVVSSKTLKQATLQSIPCLITSPASQIDALLHTAATTHTTAELLVHNAVFTLTSVLSKMLWVKMGIPLLVQI